MNILRLLPDSVFRNLREEAVASVVLALQKNDKIVSGKTAKSIRSEIEFPDNQDEANISVVGGEWLRYIIEGKPANTKLPVRKTSDGWELVQDLKNWKAIVGFGGSDFLLARTIAKNPRAPVDIPGDAIKIFETKTFKEFSDALAKLSAKEIKKDVK